MGTTAVEATNIVEEPPWKRITVRSKRRRRHCFSMELKNRFQLLEEECVRQDAEETPQEDMNRAEAKQNMS